MPCRELRFCLWYFMWSTKIRKTVFVQKVAEIKRKHPKSEDFRCCFGAAGRIRTADLILTKDALYLLSYSSEWRPRRDSNPRPPA